MQGLKNKTRSGKVRNSEFGIRNGNRGIEYAAARRSALRTPRSTFRGFTLVEMLVVIVIIGVLMGLAIPAMMRARIAVIEGRVITEISGLSSAISSFKAKYGVEPPSRFSIYLTQAGWSGDPTNMAIVRRIWPQFDFTLGDANATGATKGTNYPAFWWDTLGGTNHVINLNSSECLLFFLGGVIPVQGQNQVPVGFAKNPVYPFAPPTTSANREGPFFELTDVSRIKDLDGNGVNEWYDSIPNQSSPLLYFSSYEGAGYRTAELPNNGTSFTALNDVYRISSTAGTLPPASPTTTFPGSPLDSRSLPAQKPQSFQIISPGYDGQYGSGGVHNPNLPNSGLVTATGTPDTVAYDNLTNFHGGRLKP